ncbi:MAG: hypothetical protein U9N86_13725 [Bacteroidota bacterium]|nr:hypothetical protein [Bacteroidota bacterium]
MKRIFNIIIPIALLIGLVVGLQAFNSPGPTLAPSSTTIKLTYTAGLDFGDCDDYPYHELKVEFFGSRYSDGQDVWDPSSPFVMGSYYFSDPVYCGCSNFYYQDGRALVYSKDSTGQSWVYQGDMFMSSSNCTMSGSKVTMFTVDCRYLDNQ